MHYVIYAEDTHNSMEIRRSVRAAHLQHLEALNEKGRLLLAGPFYRDEMIVGSLIVGEFDHIEAAKAWAAADPYATAGVFARVTINPFKKVLP